MGFQFVFLFNGIFILSSWLLWYGHSRMFYIQLYTFSIYWNVLYQKNYILSSVDISSRFSVLTSFSMEYLKYFLSCFDMVIFLNQYGFPSVLVLVFPDRFLDYFLVFKNFSCFDMVIFLIQYGLPSVLHLF